MGIAQPVRTPVRGVGPQPLGAEDQPQPVFGQGMADGRSGQHVKPFTGTAAGRTLGAR